LSRARHSQSEERDVSDMKETCGIHAGYMQHTCILRGNQVTCRIRSRIVGALGTVNGVTYI
jgi:hypothetical protein